MKQKAHYGSRRQQGIALPIIMIILVLAALVTIYTTTTSVKEQQVTADQYRSEQAFSVAQAGVEHAVNTHNDYTAVYDDVSGNYLPSGGALEGSFDKGSYTVMFCDIWDDDDDEAKSAELMADFLTDTVSCSNSIANISIDADGFHNDERVGILSVGKPDDASGRRTISVVSAPARLLNSSDNPFPPLSAQGSIAVTGSVAVINRYQHLNIWSGEVIDVGSAAVGTFINNGTLERSQYPAGADGDRDYRVAMTSPSTDDITKGGTVALASNRDVGVNSDIVDSDFNLVNVDLFEGAFSPDKEMVRDYAIAVGNGNIFTNTTDILGKTGLIWLESSSALSLNTGTVGTFDAPAFLIVDLTNASDPTFTISNKSIHGLVFVFGNAMLLGAPEVYGSVMATGSVGVAHSAAGGGTIVYDPESLAVDPEGLSGLRGIEPGTWKDWGYVK